MERTKFLYMLLEMHSVIRICVGGGGGRKGRKKHRCSSIIFLVIFNMKISFQSLNIH